MIGDIETLCKLANIKINLMKTDPKRFFVRAFMAAHETKREVRGL